MWALLWLQATDLERVAQTQTYADCVCVYSVLALANSVNMSLFPYLGISLLEGPVHTTLHHRNLAMTSHLE